MPVTRIKEFLDENKIEYVTIQHSPAFTAQKIAAAAHVPGKELAKTVMVKLDGKMAMAVLPASYKVDFEQLKEAAHAETVELASEREFREMFPGCEVGAMPPFGNLYGMDVFVAQRLAEDDDIAFNAGSHSELIKLSFKDFAALVKPHVTKFAAKLR